MKTDEQIHKIISNNFTYTGTYKIVNGVINVTGSITYTSNRFKVLPITFGVVTGYFSCENKKITSLKGFPDCYYLTIRDCLNIESWGKLPTYIGFLDITGSSFYRGDIDIFDDHSATLIFDTQDDEDDYNIIRRKMVLDGLLNDDMTLNKTL